ncbi:hypothetical protein VD0002_g8998 [Verticillium dahliae]|uniref:Uncharacterized protein n=1 Tax=Verticillium dahliae TaxID=27337 RepID=A0A2J8D4U1_VERDA|nr:hypothetical protein BJF96_g9441 [Verticillium dahliae]PNH44290.1 hypothetical protein VD0003_g9455 [Verticillium dahliae]PNH46931.1 hypothetical protein VD0004_g1245 [Verticillium dahliae]PNH58533.1 hypothetical protein VD0002_g8998 [Verticillium dahliae]PNH74988.1 hypothetical protein VD0001_g2596 [Verticillium dahliae]
MLPGGALRVGAGMGVRAVVALIERVFLVMLVRAVVACVQLVAVVVEVLSRAGRRLAVVARV